MSQTNDDLDNFLGVLTKRLQASPSGDTEALRDTLEEGDAVDLAVHTADLDDALAWLVGTVRTTARFSPSAAFALAAQYAVQHGLQTVGAPTIENPTSGVVNAAERERWTVTVPTLFAPQNLVLLDRAAAAAAEVSWDAIDVADPVDARRSGLRQAALRTYRPRGALETLSDTSARSIAATWDVLTATVALGIAERALTESETYAGERRQFGAAISSFAGLRAILTEMTLKVSGVQAQLNQAVRGAVPSDEVLAVAGRVAVDVCLDAIQVHGGYGYIDEYPVAGLLRDALSVRARGGGRRALVAQVGARRLGDPEMR